MTKFLFKFKKPYFWPFLAYFPNFGGKKVFPQNRVAMHNFLRVSGTMPKFREIQFQENTQTDVRGQGWTEPIS